MDIKESATYPYPIWGLHDSFLGEAPQVGGKSLTENNETNTLDISFEVTTHNIGIDRLISEGKAKYKCVIECSATYFQMNADFEEPRIKVSVPYDKVYNRFSVKTFIVATQEIIQCDYLELDDIYEGIADYPKGGIIAYIDEFTVTLKQRNNASDLSKIVKIMKANVSSVKNVYNGDRIVIKIPMTYGQRFDVVVSLCPAVIESTFVFNALVQGIYKLREETDTSKDWVFYLQQFVKECDEKGIINLDNEEYKIELDDIVTIVEHLLGSPQLNALDDIISHTENGN